jgi:large subunit ribosomal protein L15
MKQKINLGNLKPSAGSVKKRKRIGRGPGSGHGKTSTRGHKGQKARAGAKRRAWFEGGQMPIQRRLPKRGFTNIFKKEYQIVNLASLSKCKDQEIVSPSVMREFGLIKRLDLPVKVLGDGEMPGPVTIQANAFSKKAKEKIEALGGKVEKI